jgi:hypothetical protein
MKLGAYTAVLHDRPLPEALAILREPTAGSRAVDDAGGQ